MPKYAGKPFKLPPWRTKELNAIYRAKDQVAENAVKEMAAVLNFAADEILNHYLRTGRFAEPSLNSMDVVTESFYRNVLTEAWRSIHKDKSAVDKRRLAGSPRLPPKGVKSVDEVFANSNYWRSVLKRSGILSQRMKKTYLRKLKKKFDEIVPLLTSGEISPRDAKAKLVEAWDSTKSRIETIFRTETTNYFARSQVSFYADEPEIIGFLFDSVRDTARTDICKSRQGLVYKPGTKLLTDNTPALHYNCRSHLIPLANTPQNRKLVDDKGRDPELRKVVPLPKGWRK